MTNDGQGRIPNRREGGTDRDPRYLEFVKYLISQWCCRKTCNFLSTKLSVAMFRNQPITRVHSADFTVFFSTFVRIEGKLMIWDTLWSDSASGGLWTFRRRRRFGMFLWAAIGRRRRRRTGRRRSVQLRAAHPRGGDGGAAIDDGDGGGVKGFVSQIRSSIGPG